MRRDLKHYLDILDRNPMATVGASLAAKMVLAAAGIIDPDSETIAPVTRRLLNDYGDALSIAQVRHELERTDKLNERRNQK
jgi:hypothetical protein